MFLNCKTNENVMPPEKIQVSARISKELHDKCIQLYDNMTTAIITGLEMACKSSENNCNIDENNCNIGENSNKELNALLEEKDRHIETLKKELEISQETHRNYMLQMQTLINQKAIEAPGAKKPWWRFW